MKSQKVNISFKPKQVSKTLLTVLSKRAQDVISGRYGLGGKDIKKMTLESIGKKYKITRERVRQIENNSLLNIRKSKEYQKLKSVFEELKNVVKSLGSLISEEELLSYISKDKSTINHVQFLLVVGEDFFREKEDEHFKHRWNIDKDLSKKIHEAIKNLYESMTDDQILSESDMIKNFLQHLKDVSEEYKNEEIVKRWLSISKKIGQNKLGEWGKTESPNINTKGMRDYAFLVIRKHGSPIHFKEVAKLIYQWFNKKAHIATTHNELIKDPRFVLVGRGLYALSEWGYMSGVVKDVIKNMLQKHGPMTKEEIVDKVMKERYVKENTIMVNLQNNKVFKKTKEGKYTLV